MADAVLETGKLDFQLKVLSPFIVCFHHRDHFPKGNGYMEPVHYLAGRIDGNDFRETAPWRMYHGDTIPGFPVHPHRGFETVTVVTEGIVDHADGAGCGGRYGHGDVQWMTAGRGLQHSEMFPLVHTDKENPMELFQIWLNLPAKAKFVSPHYKMLWDEEIPVITQTDTQGNHTRIRIINGSYGDVTFYQANPDSWAFDPEHHVNIWLIEMEPQAKFTMPAVSSTANRILYYYEGDALFADSKEVGKRSYIVARSGEDLLLQNGSTPGKILLLEGEPILEPVAAYGPFVMNTYEEIRQAYEDYNETGFGGWPWEDDGPVHNAELGRFASYPNGTTEYPPK